MIVSIEVPIDVQVAVPIGVDVDKVAIVTGTDH